MVKLNKRQLLVYHSVVAEYFPHLSQQCVWPQRSACMKTKAIVASRIITFRAQRGLKPDPLNCSSYSVRAGVLTTDAVYCQHVYRWMKVPLINYFTFSSSKDQKRMIQLLLSQRNQCSRNAKLLGHVQLVLPVSFQMLPGSGTFLFKTIIWLELVHLYQSASHYQLSSTPCLANKTGLRRPSIQRCV